MSRIEESIDVDVSAATAYEQWSRVEEFPRFMEGVESVHRTGDNKLHWRASIAGKSEEWTAFITEEIPEKRIAWASDDGVHNAGVVTFHPLDEGKARIMLQMEYKPEGAIESVGDAVGITAHRVKNDLANFKRVVENG